MDPPASGGPRVVLTLPDLPERTIRQCHGFLRELLFTFEDHYEQQLARAYGWVTDLPDGDREDEDEDEDDWFSMQGRDDV